MSKRILIGILLGSVCFYFLFLIGVLPLVCLNIKDFEHMLGWLLGWWAFISLLASFSSGFVSAWFSKKKEIIVSFVSFFISYTPWVYFQFKESSEAFLFYKRARINIIAPYIVLILIAILGGFVAKKLREKQEKDPVN